MVTYTINYTIDQTSVGYMVDAQQTVQIIKGSQYGQYQVVWLSLTPEETNMVTWEENYTLYQTNTEIQNGATIVQGDVSDGYVNKGALYQYTASGISLSSNPGNSGEFGLYNATAALMYGGLSQAATTNSGSIASTPMCVTAVPPAETAFFIPEVTFVIGAASLVNNGSVITQTQSTFSTYTLTSASPSISLAWDSATAQFVLAQ